MDFLKKHYEKVILSLVLVGLVVAAGWLPIKVAAVRDTLEQATQQYSARRVRPLAPLNLTTNESDLRRLLQPSLPAFATASTMIFNPTTWERHHGNLIPRANMGASALVVTAIHPLKTQIDFLGARQSAAGLVYDFRTSDQSSTNYYHRETVVHSIAPDGKTFLFAISKIEGPKANPKAVVLQLVDSGKSVTVTTNSPYQQVSGYDADLLYPINNRTFSSRRVGSKLTLAGETYNIIAISDQAVTLENKTTRKRTIVKLKATQ